MGSYTVQIVSGEVRDWNSSKGGPMKSYRIGLTDEQGNNINGVEWARKVDSPAPQVGQKLEGTLETTDYGPKFKATPQGGGGRGRDPVEEARTRRSIQMQHAQKCAVDALKLAAEFGQGDEKYRPPSAADVVAQVKLIAAGLFAQVEEVAG